MTKASKTKASLLVGDARQYLREFAEDYRVLFDLAYDPQASHWVDDRVTGGEDPDPTMNAAASRARLKGDLALKLRRLQSLRDGAERLYKDLHEIMLALEEGPRRRDDVEYPRLISDEEAARIHLEREEQERSRPVLKEARS